LQSDESLCDLMSDTLQFVASLIKGDVRSPSIRRMVTWLYRRGSLAERQTERSFGTKG
jgi:hypothetical protein